MSGVVWFVAGAAVIAGAYWGYRRLLARADSEIRATGYTSLTELFGEQVGDDTLAMVTEDTGVKAMKSVGWTETSPGVWEAEFAPGSPDVKVMLGDDSIPLEDIPVEDLVFMGSVLADIDDLPTTEEAES